MDELNQMIQSLEKLNQSQSKSLKEHSDMVYNTLDNLRDLGNSVPLDRSIIARLEIIQEELEHKNIAETVTFLVKEYWKRPKEKT